MVIFDGYQFAAKREEKLRQLVANLEEPPVVAAVLFEEDAGSRLYTRLKKEAAERVGISYQVNSVSISDTLSEIIKTIRQLNDTQKNTGIIVQKPTKRVWEKSYTGSLNFSQWWLEIMTAVDQKKDVDGLHPDTLQLIKVQKKLPKNSFVLPATCKAVIAILEESAQLDLTQIKTIILGKSDLLGTPLAYYLRSIDAEVELLGKKELAARVDSGQQLKDAQLIVSATGQHHLITGEMISAGAYLVDAGEPLPDIDQKSVATTADFLTPVPGGVGPVTVISLLENAVSLLK